MIYLDANAFYWYYGRDKLALQQSVPNLDVEKFRKYMDSLSDNKCLPASAFMEMIVHFRDRHDIIKKIILFREKKNFKILNNFQGYCFSPNELAVLSLTNIETILGKYAYKLLDNKIEIEVTHANVYLQVVSLLYADYYLKSCCSLNEENKGKILSYLGRDLSNEMKEDHYSELKNALKAGYADNNKAMQYLKNKYIEILTQNCVIFRMIIDIAVKFIDDEQDLYSVMCRSVDLAKNNGFTDSGVMKAIVEALAKDSDFLKYSEKEIANIFQRKGYSKHQAQYLQMMLEAWLERGQKIRKNDIFDMFCVGVLDKIENNTELNIMIDQRSYLISFDKVMMEFICRDSWNEKLINKFAI